ncbi:disrupted in schizophrenia 1 protein [Thalassophryne amazonica]|uniref:disrupted in schizophrenia 1 protein n=1 Tax=Thalassophryne amazonica TaxID=390379 RepID=UPI001471D9A2|nr:disrupted in schizophrenia 1 protein [Thalassophryne amazonica]
MFAGLMAMDCHHNSLLHHCEVLEGGRVSGTVGSFSHKKIYRRPGYMKGELSRVQNAGNTKEDEEHRRSSCITDGKSGRQIDISEQNAILSPPVSVSLLNQHQPDQVTCSVVSSVTRSVLTEHCCPLNSSQQSSLHKFRSKPNPALRSCSVQSRLTPSNDSFNSSFSFIQESLNCSQLIDVTATATATNPEPEPLTQSTKAPSSLEATPVTSSFEQLLPKSSAPIPLLPSSASGSQTEREEPSMGGRFWRECLWGDRQSDPTDSDSQSLDTEVTSSLSVDSDTASSVTSGYESTTPTSDHGWDNLVKKYDGVLQDCLQNNRTHIKIESMMLKLQRLQQKAILDDDYDAAERFGKKLEELCQERSDLKLGLPSTQPSVALFLDRLRQVVHSALQRADCSQRREGAEADGEELSDVSPLCRRDRLIQEKRLVEVEMEELQQRLIELKDRRLHLDQQIQQEEQQVEAEEVEGSALRSCTVAQLRDISRTLQDLVTSENRNQILVRPPPSVLRLQEQEHALNLSIKEATAKVVMSQRLGSSLRRKVSETETQLLALHEAKLAAISGNDFGSAKELKAEIKAVYLERDRLEALAKRLRSLSLGSSQELSRMKEQRQQLRQELEQREAQHDSRLKENTTKYIELLEDRLNSCGCPGLDWIWEADLEACYLFLRGLQLRAPSCNGANVEDLPTAAVAHPMEPCTKEEEDCAMLTALGGRWCPDANLQNSEFTKKLEEFLFCMEDNHQEDECSEAADLTEHCELISDRLMTLEDELQTAILNRDKTLTQSLEKEVREVKATLQAMLAQLKEEEQDEEEIQLQDADLMNSRTEEEEEEDEDQYFSDSWDI